MLSVAAIRAQFPALGKERDGMLPAYFDGPGGTQVPQVVIDHMVRYLAHCNANHGGAFATSRESDAILHTAHERVAELLNAASSDEILFGANMTTLTMHLSRALARTWRAGDKIVVTRMDHDANVTPWVLAARDAGAHVRFVDIHPEDCTLDLVDLHKQLADRPRLVAVTCASNAVGTFNDVALICRQAHDAGALVFLDAVHYVPHRPVDVQAWSCDFLACSAYKFFGPHVGILWGKRALLEELPAYKLRPVPETLPDRWMTGTQNHEGLAGVVGAVEYLKNLSRGLSGIPSRGGSVGASMTAIRSYESTLVRRLLEGLADRKRFKVWGITDLAKLDQRVPTVALTHRELAPLTIAEHLASRQIFAWHGNMYAIGLSERLGLEQQGGFLRIGLVHYNTIEEIDRLLGVLDELS